MKITSYSAKGHIYVYIKAASTPEESIPADILKKLGSLVKFKTHDIEKVEKIPRIGMDTKEVYSSIESKGYHIDKADIRTTEN